MSASTKSQQQTSGEVSANGEVASDERLSATDAAVECFRQYAKERSEAVALWTLGIGFVLGWKLKPW